jgi:ubiquitin C-terminal hydrolase
MKLDLSVGKEFKDPESAYSFYMSSNRSIIDKCFAGQITSTVNCAKCGENSHTYLPFIEISLAITDTTLEGCLKKHFSNESTQFDLFQNWKILTIARSAKRKARPLRNSHSPSLPTI